MSEQRKPLLTDLVQLVNVSGEGEHEKDGKTVKRVATDQVFSYNGIVHTVKIGKHLVLKREIANHGVKKCFSAAENHRKVKIVELPYDQRSAEEMPVISEELIKVKSEADALKKELADKTKECADLKLEVAHKDEKIEALNDTVKKLEKKLK